MEHIGAQCHAHRAELLIATGQGLTELYNRFHDPDEGDARIAQLRALHEAMDRAVLDSYGWTDIQPRCEFIPEYEDEERGDAPNSTKKHKPYRYRWPDDIRDEVLGRLLKLNADRALAERVQGNASGPSKAKARAAERMRGQSSLLE